MPKVDVYNMQGKKVSDVELNEAVSVSYTHLTLPTKRIV